MDHLWRVYKTEILCKMNTYICTFVLERKPITHQILQVASGALNFCNNEGKIQKQVVAAQGLKTQAEAMSPLHQASGSANS